MMTGGSETRRFDWILDALASRVGIVAVVGLLLSICIGVGYYIQTFVNQLEESQAIFLDRQTRNGYVAMSDIQRLILVTQRAAEIGEMSPELESEFVDAADIMYVRTDNFERIMNREQTKLASGEESIDALKRIVAIADDALADGFPDLTGLLDALLAANAVARTHLVQFLDDMRREGERVLEAQSRAVRQQQIVVLANLVGLTLVGSLALYFLRMEVLTRHARERAEKRVEFLAYFDPLTKLPNRAQFQERLQEVLLAKRPAALIYADLDDFKLINDTHGHTAGDAVLTHVGRLLMAVSESHVGFAARLAGDEFAMVIPSDDIECLNALCAEIISATSEPYWFEGESFNIGLSLGLATTKQLHSTEDITVDMLSRFADFALYTSKATGRKCYTVYDHVIEQRFWERRSLIEELPKAIEQQKLEVFLQPKVHLRDGRAYGFEALVRWRRNGELVPPGDFINIAEECGLVVDIDHYVLRQATRLIAKWNKAHDTDFSVSVNLSALHFNSERICHWVEQALWDAVLPAQLLTLEITETTEMRDWKQARRIIGDLKSTGCKIAIDDFGTGFSSLAYLRIMKAHELKIDRSLVMELDVSGKARLLLSSVLEMARNLELEVTIEGIETEEQSSIVREMGAECAQGFLFGRPLPPEEALAAAMTPNPALVSSQAS